VPVFVPLLPFTFQNGKLEFCVSVCAFKVIAPIMQNMVATIGLTGFMDFILSAVY
jgi:hypothetical protein